MAQDLSIEDPTAGFLTTTRTMNSALWFVNNPILENRILASLAKYREKYGVRLNGFVMMGNHPHIAAKYPRANKSLFMRAFNSAVAKHTAELAEGFPGGKLWARRARSQKIPNPEDVEHQFFYCALNPVSSGLVPKISEYQGYNSFSDAISGRKRKFKVLNRTAYNNAKRKNPNVRREDYITVHTLEYERLPGYEDVPDKEYRTMMLKKLEARRVEIVRARLAEGKGFAGPEKLKKTKPGSLPRSTKTSERHTPRPLILTLCAETRKHCLNVYFSILAAYKRASEKYRSGIRDVKFPPGTYAPSVFCGLAPP